MQRSTMDRSGIRRWWTLASLLTLATLLTGCEFSDRFARSNDDRVMIQMTEGNQFSPSTVTIPVGSTVVWWNPSKGPHTVSFVDAADVYAVEERRQGALGTPAAAIDDTLQWHSGDLYTAGRWSRTFDAPGEYIFVCQRHQGSGMIGVVIVEPENDD